MQYTEKNVDSWRLHSYGLRTEDGRVVRAQWVGCEIGLRNGSAISGQGSNSVQVRHGNERVILTLLRRLGTAAKADLARHANLTANTVGQIVQGLETAGLVRSDGKRHRERGQPATLLCLDPQGACSIGVKAGRRSLDTILVDFTGRVLEQRHRECPFSLPEQAAAMLVEDIAAVRGTLAAAHRPAHLAGLGIATPYNLGCWQRELDIPTEAYRAWNDFDLAARLAAHVVVDGGTRRERLFQLDRAKIGQAARRLRAVS